jgi:hypothetical protein
MRSLTHFSLASNLTLVVEVASKGNNVEGDSRAPAARPTRVGNLATPMGEVGGWNNTGWYDAS